MLAALLFTLPRTGAAQEPSSAELALLASSRAMVERFGGAASERVWPAFRPDTIPCAYVFRDRGTVLLGWRGALPPGYAPLEGLTDAAWSPVGARGAAATSIEVAGRVLAQVPVDPVEAVELFAVTVHEAFHAFERASRREGRRFGSSENTYYVASYPVFDARNEAGVALEGRVLRAALAARNGRERRTLAEQFLALREARHTALDGNFATFEAMVELNEGLAEYAQVRALMWAGANAQVRARVAELDRLTANTAQSFRLRFYRTGPAIALLLDRLTPGWQARLQSADRTLQGQLAEAVGFHARETALRDQAASRFELPWLLDDARAAVAALMASRRRRADSLLAQPGVTVIVQGRFNLCGFDPQNLLRVDSVAVLHTRWLRICGANGLDAEFNTPVLEDNAARTVRAIAGPAGEVQAVPADAGVRITSPGLTLRATAATMTRDGDTIRVRLP